MKLTPGGKGATYYKPKAITGPAAPPNAHQLTLNALPPNNYLALKKAIPRRIKAVLKQRGLTQNWLANRLGVSRVQVSYWISGSENISIESIAKISRALNARIINVID